MRWLLRVYSFSAALQRLELCARLRERCSSSFARRLVGVVLGLVLLFAATMKMAVDQDAPRTTDAAWPPVATVVAFEFALAVWLISGIRWNAARMVALGCFGMFAGVSAATAASGETSCGCFGAARVSPLAIGTLDLAAICLLLFCRAIPSRQNVNLSLVDMRDDA